MGASDFANLPHIGESVLRKEDYRFLTGAGQYTDDVVLANQAHAVFVRSPHAHARIKSINTKAAQTSAGVLGVYVGTDVANDKINGLPCGWLITSTEASMAASQTRMTGLNNRVLPEYGDGCVLAAAHTRNRLNPKLLPKQLTQS